MALSVQPATSGAPVPASVPVRVRFLISASSVVSVKVPTPPDVQVIGTLVEMVSKLLAHLEFYIGATQQPAVHRSHTRGQPFHSGPIRQAQHLRSPAG